MFGKKVQWDIPESKIDHVIQWFDLLEAHQRSDAQEGPDKKIPGKIHLTNPNIDGIAFRAYKRAMDLMKSDPDQFASYFKDYVSDGYAAKNAAESEKIAKKILLKGKPFPVYSWRAAFDRIDAMNNSETKKFLKKVSRIIMVVAIILSAAYLIVAIGGWIVKRFISLTGPLLLLIITGEALLLLSVPAEIVSTTPLLWIVTKLGFVAQNSTNASEFTPRVMSFILMAMATYAIAPSIEWFTRNKDSGATGSLIANILRDKLGIGDSEQVAEKSKKRIALTRVASVIFYAYLYVFVVSTFSLLIPDFEYAITVYLVLALLVGAVIVANTSFGTLLEIPDEHIDQQKLTVFQNANPWLSKVIRRSIIPFTVVSMIFMAYKMVEPFYTSRVQPALVKQVDSVLPVQNGKNVSPQKVYEGTSQEKAAKALCDMGETKYCK